MENDQGPSLPRRQVRSLTYAIAAFAAVWHVLAVCGDAWLPASREHHGRDFASYYYAVQVADRGEDPYQAANLGQAARDEQTRTAVHPFFYPPPSVFFFSWTRSLGLGQAYRIWFWLDEVAALACLGLLIRGWRTLSPAVPAVACIAFALLGAIPNNHLMGQANLLAMALALGGVMLAEGSVSRNRVLAGGALVGAAAMLKMSPGLFVVWWLIQRRWAPAVAAVVSAIVLSGIALPWVDFNSQVDFYTRVLPGFSSGLYNGLHVPVRIFGNHSVPGLIDGFFSNGKRPGLSSTAWAISMTINVVLMGGTLWSLRKPAADALSRAAQFSALSALMLLMPVFTYEHHVVWALPAVIVGVVALWEGRLPQEWAVPFGFAVAVWCFDLSTAKSMAGHVADAYPSLGRIIAEFKFVALFIFFATNLWVGRATHSLVRTPSSDAVPEKVVSPDSVTATTTAPRESGPRSRKARA